MAGHFYGLLLVSELHIGNKLFNELVDVGSGLDREYEIARRLAAGRLTHP